MTATTREIEADKNENMAWFNLAITVVLLLINDLALWRVLHK